MTNRRRFLKGVGLVAGGAVLGSLASRLAEAYSIPSVEKTISPRHPSYTADVIIYRDGDKAVAVDAKGNTIAKSTDHAEVIQSAIDNLPEDGGMVFIKRGVYELSSRVNLKPYVTLEGEGGGAAMADPTTVTYEGYGTVLKHAPDVNFDKGMVYGYKAHGVTIRNIVFDGNKVNIPEHTNRFRDNNLCLEDTWSALIERCVFINSLFDGILFWKGGGSVIRDNQFFGCGKKYGIAITLHGPKPKFVVVSGNYAVDSGLDHGIEAHTAQYSVIAHNTLRWYYVSPKTCITNAGESKGLVIAHNVCELYSNVTSGTGIHLGSNVGTSEENIIMGNYLYNVYTGISISTNGDYEQRNNIVIGNIIASARKYGIRVSREAGAAYAPEHVYIRDNIVLGANGSVTGVELVELNTGCVEGNRISGFSTPINVSAVKNVKIRRNIGWVTENEGVVTFSGDGTTTDFLLGTHDLSPSLTDPSKVVVNCTPVSPDAVDASPLTCYLSDEDGDGVYESIRVRFTNPPQSGTDNVKIAWRAEYIG